MIHKKISLGSLVLLIVAGIDSIRTLPTTAFFGSSLIFYFLLSSLFFLFPIAFISAEFSSRYPHEGGIFHWVRHAFGEKMGALAVWLQWINTMVWYPTMLLFIAGTAAYVIDPQLAQNKLFLTASVLITFWMLTLVNLKGIRLSATISGYCAMIGTLFPMLCLIGLGIVWILLDQPIAISFDRDSLIPPMNNVQQYGILVTIMASLLGMELAGVHVSDIENPENNFPKAVGYSVLLILSSLILSALSVAVVIPAEKIHFVDGVMQTFTAFFNAFHLTYLISLFATLIIIGSIGGSINWLLSPARGVLQMGESGFLPPWLSKKNKHNVPISILIVQACFVSLLSIMMQWIPHINTYYWFLMALSTSLYMLMYILLLLSALKLRRPSKDSTAYQIPKGMRTPFCLMGLIGCIITILVCFQPTTEEMLNPWKYILSMGLGLCLMLLPAPLMWLYNRSIKKQHDK